MGVIEELEAAGLAVYESGFTALDAYHGVRQAPLRFALVEGGVVEVAKAREGLSFPGLSYADAAFLPEARVAAGPGSGSPGAGKPGTGRPGAAEPLAAGTGDLPSSGEAALETPLYLRFSESMAGAEPAAFAPLDLLREPRKRGAFHDPKGVYPALREKRLEARPAEPERAIFEAAALVSRYAYELDPGFRPVPPRDFPLAAQRDLLALVLTGTEPGRGLDFLKSTGFIDEYWPELADLAGVDQAKEFHPEGDVWAHTLETFRYRKLPDFRLSLGLLLHDSGKPRASASGGRRFDRHAELGAEVARRFLGRLGFQRSLQDDVAYLVRYHMLPAAIARLPLERGIEGVDAPLFPLLLELYKCDELSSFKGPEGYYEACAAYRAWLRNARNPWRNPEALALAKTFLGA